MGLWYPKGRKGGEPDPVINTPEWYKRWQDQYLYPGRYYQEPGAPETPEVALQRSLKEQVRTRRIGSNFDFANWRNQIIIPLEATGLTDPTEALVNAGLAEDRSLLPEGHSPLPDIRYVEPDQHARDLLSGYWESTGVSSIDQPSRLPLLPEQQNPHVVYQEWARGQREMGRKVVYGTPNVLEGEVSAGAQFGRVMDDYLEDIYSRLTDPAFPSGLGRDILNSGAGDIFQIAVSRQHEKKVAPLVGLTHKLLENKAELARLKSDTLNMGADDPILKEARARMGDIGRDNEDLRAKISLHSSEVGDVESKLRAFFSDSTQAPAITEVDIGGGIKIGTSGPFTGFWQTQSQSPPRIELQEEIDLLTSRTNRELATRASAFHDVKQTRTILGALSDGLITMRDGRLTGSSQVAVMGDGRLGYVDDVFDTSLGHRDTPIFDVPGSGTGRYIPRRPGEAAQDVPRPGLAIRPMQLSPQVARQFNPVSTSARAGSEGIWAGEPGVLRSLGALRSELKFGANQLEEKTTSDYRTQARETVDLRYSRRIRRGVEERTPVRLAHVVPMEVGDIPEVYHKFLGINEPKTILNYAHLKEQGLSNVEGFLADISSQGVFTESEARDNYHLIERASRSENRRRKSQGLPELTEQEAIADLEIRRSATSMLPKGPNAERQALGLRVLREGTGDAFQTSIEDALSRVGVTRSNLSTVAGTLQSSVRSPVLVGAQEMVQELIGNIFYSQDRNSRAILSSVLDLSDDFSKDASAILEKVAGVDPKRSNPYTVGEGLKKWASNVIGVRSSAQGREMEIEHEERLAEFRGHMDTDRPGVLNDDVKGRIEPENPFEDFPDEPLDPDADFGEEGRIWQTAADEDSRAWQTGRGGKLRLSAQAQVHGVKDSDAELILKSIYDFHDRRAGAGFYDNRNRPLAAGVQASEEGAQDSLQDVARRIRTNPDQYAPDPRRLPLFAGTPEDVNIRIQEAIRTGEEFELTVPHPIDARDKSTVRFILNGVAEPVSAGEGQKPSLRSLRVSMEILGSEDERIRGVLALTDIVETQGGYQAAKARLTAAGRPIGLNIPLVLQHNSFSDSFSPQVKSRFVQDSDLENYARRLGADIPRNTRRSGVISALQARIEDLSATSQLSDMIKRDNPDMIGTDLLGSESIDMGYQTTEGLSRDIVGVAESIGIENPDPADMSDTLRRIQLRMNRLISQTLQSAEELRERASSLNITLRPDMSDDQIEAAVDEKIISNLTDEILEPPPGQPRDLSPERVRLAQAEARNILREASLGAQLPKGLGSYSVTLGENSDAVLTEHIPAHSSLVKPLSDPPTKVPKALDVTSERHVQNVNVLHQMRNFAAGDKSKRTTSIFNIPLNVKQGPGLAGKFVTDSGFIDPGLQALREAFDADAGPDKYSLEMVQAIQDSFAGQDRTSLLKGRDNPIKKLFRRMRSQVAEPAVKQKLYGPTEAGLLMWRKGAEGGGGRGTTSLGSEFANLTYLASLDDYERSALQEVGINPRREAQNIAGDIRDVMRGHVRNMVTDPELFNALHAPLQRTLVEQIYGDATGSTGLPHIDQVLAQVRHDAGVAPDAPLPRPPPVEEAPTGGVPGRPSMMGEAIEGAEETAEALPNMRRPLGEGAEAAGEGGREAYKRISKEGLKGFFNQSRIVKGGVAGAGATVAIALLASRRKKDYSQDDMGGPVNLPGGSAYEQMPQAPQVAPEYSLDQSQGVSYQVQARGDYDYEQLQAQILDITGGEMQSTAHDAPARVDQARDRDNRERERIYAESSKLFAQSALNKIR